jgi:hypothetical protein
VWRSLEPLLDRVGSHYGFFVGVGGVQDIKSRRASSRRAGEALSIATERLSRRGKRREVRVK